MHPTPIKFKFSSIVTIEFQHDGFILAIPSLKFNNQIFFQV